MWFEVLPGIAPMGACSPTPRHTHGKAKRVAITAVSGLCGTERGVSLKLTVTIKEFREP